MDGSVQPTAAEPPRRRLSRPSGAQIWLVIAAAVTALKLWLVSAQTLYAVAPSPGDDQLFLSSAEEILGGAWLGPLSDLTLVKGPGYSLWLSLVYLSGQRLLLAQAALYAVASAVFARSLKPAVRESWRRSAVYAVLLLNPASWADGPATRVMREGIYSSLTVLLLGLAIGAALRLRSAPRASTLWGAAAGLTGALFAVTREEGVWLVPSLAIVALAGWLAARRSGWRSAAGPVLAVAVSYAVPTAAIASLNWKHYGLFGISEVRAGYYTAACQALARVKTANPRPYVPVPREARLRLYEASPAFREVGPFLEEEAPAWAVHGCRTLGVCDDIAGGWFQWALRQAAFRAGVYRSGAEARAWYERVTREIDDACGRGRLECSPPSSPFMPGASSLGALLGSFGRAAFYTATLQDVTAYPSLPEINPAFIGRFEQVTHERLPRPVVHMVGVVTSRVGEVQATVLDDRYRPAASAIRRARVGPAGGEADDGHAARTRISLETGCVLNCSLALYTADRRAIEVPVGDDEMNVGDPLALAWTTETFQRYAAPSPVDDARVRRLAWLTGLTRVLSFALPALSTAALALLAWRLVGAARARALTPLTTIALALLAGYASRLLVVALVDVTSFPAVTVLYLSPAYGLLVAFTAVVLVGGRDGPAAGASSP